MIGKKTYNQITNQDLLLAMKDKLQNLRTFNDNDITAIMNGNQLL